MNQVAQKHESDLSCYAVSRQGFINRLKDTMLFTDSEVLRIAKTVGLCTAGNAIIACEVLKIELFGSDVDALISAFADRYSD